MITIPEIKEVQLRLDEIRGQVAEHGIGAEAERVVEVDEIVVELIHRIREEGADESLREPLFETLAQIEELSVLFSLKAAEMLR